MARSSFWRQLRLLLWKNFLIKRRQKLWLAVELLAPILLFLILVIIRTQNFAQYNDACHYDSKALPSAGVLPFFSDFFCRLANKCHAFPTTGDDQGTIGRDYNEKEFVKEIHATIEFLAAVGHDSTPMTVLAEHFVQVVRVLAELAKDVRSASASSRIVPLSSAFPPDSNVTETLILAGMNPADARAASNAFLTPFFFKTALQTMLEEDELSLVCEQPWILGEKVAITAFCGDNLRESVVIGDGGKPPASFCNFGWFKSGIAKHFVKWSEEMKDAAAAALSELSERTITGSQLEQLTKSSCLLLSLVSANNSQVTPLIQYALDWLENINMNGELNPDTLINILTCNTTEEIISKLSISSGAGIVQTNLLLHGEQAFMASVVSTNASGIQDVGDSGVQSEDANCIDAPVVMDYPPQCAQILFDPRLRAVFGGYILVTPDAPVVRALVAKLETALRDLNIVRSTLLDLYANAELYQSALHNSDLFKAAFVLQNWTSKLNESNQIKISQESAKRLQLLLQLVGSADDSRSLFLLLKNITAPIVTYSNCFLADRFRIYDSEADMQRIGKCLGAKNDYFSGLTFVNLSSTATEFPPFVTYKIRPAPYLTPATHDATWHRDPPWDKDVRDNPFHEMEYITFGFTYLQDAVERAVIEMKSNQSFTTGIHIQQMPYPCTSTDRFNEIILWFLPLFVVMSWVIPSSLTVKNIVHEKEMRLKEVMRVMGLGDAVHWIAWGLFSFAMSIIPIISIVVMLSAGRLFSQTNPAVLFVFFVLYSWANISKNLLLATFFDRANIASAATALIYWLDFFAYGIGREVLHGGLRKFTCIFTQTAVGWGIEELYKIELRGGFFSSQVWSHDEDSMPLLFILGMFAMQTIVQLALTWYISNVFPGQYGIAQPWYFFVMRSYWCELDGTLKNDDNETLAEQSEHAGDDFEPDPDNATLGVRVRNLRKVFGNGTVAVDSLNLKFYESQITSFLGHNGAGKTTTMSILTGLFRPTAGTAYIYGEDIRKDFSEIRQSLGMCPQHNVLFDQLTVEEQLRFYSSLKGLSRKAADIEIDQMLLDVNLEDKRNELAANLSGGMKRRLSIAVAFIGGSRTVILDEPTAGVDPHSRRGIWDLLLKYKEGRTIILSTHHMDEADVLGDRIAIIAHGRLRACGSSLFLKTRFGSGCHLVVLQRPPRLLLDSDAEEDKETRLVEFVLSNVPGSKLIEAIRSELFFSLPVALDPVIMAAFFNLFDRKRHKLGVISYGINAMSLEEIFLKVAPYDRAPLKKETGGFFNLISFLRRKCSERSTLYENFTPSASVATLASSQAGVNLSTNSEQKAYEFAKHPEVKLLEEGCGLVTQRLRALFVKRWHHNRRSVRSICFQIIVPILFIALANLVIYLIGEYQNLEDKPAMLISTSMYSDFPSSLPAVSEDDRSTLRIFASVGTETRWKSASRELLPSLTTAPGYGFCCVKMQPFHSEANECSANRTTEWTQFKYFNYSVADDSCSCRMGNNYMQIWQCARKHQPEPRVRKLPTGEFLVDMTNRNISQWLLDLHNELSWIRYGGYSLGDRNEHAVTESEKPFAVSGLFHVSGLLEQMVTNLSVQLSSTPITPAGTRFNDGQTIVHVLGHIVRNVDFEDNLKVWFNSKGWASSSLYLNAINNLILRSLLTDQDSPDTHGIALMNHPMNYSGSRAIGTVGSLADLSRTQMIQMVLMILAFNIVPASLIIFIVQERVTQAKHLQLVSGVPPWLYWVSNYVWDMANFLLSVLMVLVVLLIVQAEVYVRTGTELSALFLLLMFYGLAMCPVVFLFSFVFEAPPVAFVLFGGCSFFLALVTSLTVNLLQYIALNEMVPPDSGLFTAYNVCKIVFMVFPQYLLGQGLAEMSISYSMYKVILDMVDNNQDAKLFDDLPIPSLFSWEKLGGCYCMLAVEAIVGFALLLLIEYRRSLFLCRRDPIKALATKRASKATVAEDQDVLNERQRVLSTPAETFGLVIKDLTKMFHRKILAVDRLTVGIARGECFGLLGVNGAGKTTTFSMLTSMLQPTEGDALFHGKSILRDMQQINQMLGYCPQFDALNGRLTAKEQLTFYARIRGIRQEDVEKVVQWAIENMNLTSYADEPSDTYSGGNKRKLSTALALVGNPTVVLLDEPSAGMDPNTRRFMWNLIIQLRKDNRTVVLTSHSMEECEKLCTSIGIMVGGRLQCIGTVQHLKHTFGEGYTLLFKLQSPTDAEVSRVSQIVESQLIGARLTDRHCSTLQYRLPRGLRLGKTFRAIQQVCKAVELEDYALSQTSLDDVFINFASRHSAGEQRPARQMSLFGSMSVEEGSSMNAMEKMECERDGTVGEGIARQTDIEVIMHDADDARVEDDGWQTDEQSTNEMRAGKRRTSSLSRQDAVSDLLQSPHFAARLSESYL